MSSRMSIECCNSENDHYKADVRTFMHELNQQKMTSGQMNIQHFCRTEQSVE